MITAAKLLLFFDMTKFFYMFYNIFVTFLQKNRNFLPSETLKTAKTCFITYHFATVFALFAQLFSKSLQFDDLQIGDLCVVDDKTE